jgi:hypothetical protein
LGGLKLEIPTVLTPRTESVLEFVTGEMECVDNEISSDIITEIKNYNL